MNYIARLQEHQLNHPARKFNNPALLPARVPYTGGPLLCLVSSSQIANDRRAQREARLRSLSLPTDWVEGLIRMSNALPPERCSEDRWEQVLEDVDYVVEHWAGPACAAGWQLLELFGCAPNLGRRLDLCGLAVLLEGRKVVSVNEEGIVIATGADRHSFRRKRMEGSVPLWAARRP